MGWKCTPQIAGLVMGEPTPGQRHRANAKAFAQEAGKERFSASETLDRTRSSDNVYNGISKGADIHAEMQKQADEYTSTYTDKNGVVRSRKLRNNAVIGYAVIFNPPCEISRDWTEQQYQKFYSDSWEILKKHRPNLFSDNNVLSRIEHRDEGELGENEYHQHILGIPKDADGKYCGNGIDAKMLSELNKIYPSEMRQRGWYEMEDLDTTDWQKWQDDKEYKVKRKAEIKKNKRSINKYIKDKTKEKLEEVEEMHTNIENMLEEVEDIHTYEVMDYAMACGKLDEAYRVEQRNKEKEKELQQIEKLNNEKLQKAKIFYNQRENACKAREAVIDARSEELREQEETLENGFLELSKRKEKQEREFQRREDALEAQKIALQEEIDIFEGRVTARRNDRLSKLYQPTETTSISKRSMPRGFEDY